MNPVHHYCRCVALQNVYLHFSRCYYDGTEWLVLHTTARKIDIPEAEPNKAPLIHGSMWKDGNTHIAAKMRRSTTASDIQSVIYQCYRRGLTIIAVIRQSPWLTVARHGMYHDMTSNRDLTFMYAMREEATQVGSVSSYMSPKKNNIPVDDKCQDCLHNQWERSCLRMTSLTVSAIVI
jgi:hypothetical protein